MRYVPTARTPDLSESVPATAGQTPATRTPDPSETDDYTIAHHGRSWHIRAPDGRLLGVVGSLASAHELVRRHAADLPPTTPEDY